MSLGIIFNNNAPLMMIYMVVIMLIAFIGVSPQFLKNSKKGITFGSLCILTFLMAMFPIQSADFIYTTQYFLAGKVEHFEEFYVDLYEKVQDIIVWRAVVFGGSTLLLYITVKILKVDTKFAAFIFTISQMFMFGALRNMFGLMLMFLGIVLLFYRGSVNQLKKLLLIIGSILALYLCTFLHRSMIVYVSIALVTLVIPPKQSLVTICVLVFPILWVMIYSILIVLISNLSDPELQQSAVYYAQGERGTTIMKTLNEILKHGAYIFLLYKVIKNSIYRRKILLPKIFLFLTKYAFILMYLGFLFWGQKTGEWLYERFVWTGEISLMFVMMYYFYIYPRTRGIKIAFSILAYTILYQMAYICTHANSVYSERFNTITL